VITQASAASRWDEDNNIAYELFGVSRPSDPTLFPNTNGVEEPHTDDMWHAAQETVWNMNTDTFRTLGETSADAAGLSILVGLVRPDEGLPVSQGGQGAIDHALRMTLPAGDTDPQYIYPASHMVSTSQGADNLPLGARLRLENTPAVNALISDMPPESQIIARAMQQYGLIVADIGSAMFVTGASASVDANNNISLTWNQNDIFASNGLETLTAGDFQVVNLTPVVTALSANSGSPGGTITITGQNFSGAAGDLSVLFGTTPATSVNVISDTEVTAVVPNGTGTVDVTVQSGIDETDTISDNPDANVNAPIFGYGISATSAADKFTFSSFTPVSISGEVYNDLNGDGVLQSGEPGLSGWTIDLLSGSTTVNSTTSNSAGVYTLTGVGPGTYTLKEVPQADYFQTSPPGGSFNLTTSSGSNISGDNFGNFLVGAVTGSALIINLDPSESISIAASANNTVATLSSNNFSFSNISNITIASTTGGTLNFDGPLTSPISFNGDSAADIVNANSGTLNLAASPTIALAALNITSSAAAVMPTAMSVQSQLILSGLSIATTGRLDLVNNEMLLHYASSDPISAIAEWIRAGYNDGSWTGGGITSSAAAAKSTSYGLGYADAADPRNPVDLPTGTIEVRYTLLGDANLDGVVNGSDFSILAANFGQGVTNWDQGNFLFTSAINGADFSALAANFGQGLNLSDISVLQDSTTIQKSQSSRARSEDFPRTHVRF
jgi:hypothetical protein